MGLYEVLTAIKICEVPPFYGAVRQMSKKKIKTEKWVKREIDVKLPCSTSSCLDMFIYLAKVVDSFDPKYKYIIGLLNTCYSHNGNILVSQEKLAKDIVSYFYDNGYFEECDND